MKKLINFTLCLFLCSGAAFAEQSLSERIKLARNNNLGWPAVTYAIDQKDSEVLKFLIDMGENLEELTPGTPVYWEYDPDSSPSYWIYFDGFQPGDSPLEHAIKINNVEAVRLLLTRRLDHKANPSATKTIYSKIHKTIKENPGLYFPGYNHTPLTWFGTGPDS